MVPRDFNFNYNIVQSLARAAKGDFTMLVARLRARREPELDFAADFIERNRKRPANRPRKNFERDLKIYYFVGDRMAVGDAKKSAVEAAAEKFTLRKSAIYEILKDIEKSLRWSYPETSAPFPAESDK